MRKLGRVLGIVAVAAALQATPAQAAFAPATDPVVEAEQLSATGLAMGAAGNSIVAWSEELAGGDDGVRARRVAADGTLGPVMDISAGVEGIQPAVAVTPAGRAFVAWRSREGEPADPDGVKGRWVEPDGTLGPVLTIVEPEAGKVDALEVRVAVDPAGVATVVWRDEANNVLELRRVQPDGGLAPRLEDISGSGVLNPEIAALPDGGTVAVWRRVGGGTGKNVITAANEPGTPETISVVNGIVTTDPALALDASGNGYAIWTVQEGGSKYSLRGRRLDATGTVVGEELVIDPPSEPFLLTDISIAASTDGKFVVGWTRRPTPEENSFIANVRSLNGAGEFLSPAQPISVLPGSAERVRTGVFDNGTVAAAWGSTEKTASATLGRELGFPGLTGGPIQSLFDQGGPEYAASAPAIGAAAFLVYYPTGGSAQATVLQRFLLPPTCVDGSVTATKDTTLQVPAECSGAGIEGAQILAGPRFGTLGAYDPATGTLAYTPRGGYVRNDTFTYAALNDGGSSNPVTVSIYDRVRPRIFSLRLLRTKRTKKRARIFRVRMVSSEPVRPRIVVQRRLPGIVKGRRCVKPRSRAQLKSKVRCLRFHKVGVVQKKGYSRRWRVRLPGKLQRQLRHGGGFRIVATGTDKAHNKRTKRINVRS